MNEGKIIAGPENDDYETPQWLFDVLNHEFGFTLDGAASAKNTLLPRFSCAENPMTWDGERVFCNPPYSMIEPFVEKALAQRGGIAVLLLAVRTDSAWWQRLAEAKCAVDLRWFRKRVAICVDGRPAGSPRFASVVVIVR